MALLEVDSVLAQLPLLLVYVAMLVSVGRLPARLASRVSNVQCRHLSISGHAGDLDQSALLEGPAARVAPFPHRRDHDSRPR